MAKYTKTAWHAGRLITRNDMEKIEDQFEMITPGATNVAENYKSSETYSKGDYCLYDGELWKCIATPTGTDEEKKPKDNSTYWTKTKIMNETNSGISQSIANEYKENQNYEIGDYVTYHTDLYRCIEVTHGAWNSQKWELVILSNDITNLISVQNQQPDNDVNKIWIKKTGDSEVTLLTKDEIEENYCKTDTIAPTFSASTAYAAGDYVYYDGALYRFTADHAAGAWTGTDAAGAVIGQDVSELKSALSDTAKNLTDNVFQQYTILPFSTVNGRKLKETGVFETNENYKLQMYSVFPNDLLLISSDDYFQFQSATSIPAVLPNQNLVGTTKKNGVFVVSVPDMALYLIVSTKVSKSNASVKIVSGDSEIIKERLIPFRKNLFDKTASTEGLLKSDGTTEPNTSYITTDFIRCHAGQAFTISPRVRALCGYDSNKIFRSYSFNNSAFVNTGTVLTYTTPYDGYIRFSLPKASTDTAQIEWGSSATEYVDYGIIKLSDNVKMDALTNVISDEEQLNAYVKDVIREYSNLIDKTAMTNGYLGSSSGNITESTSYDTTDYIYVKAGVAVTFAPRVRAILAYDTSKVPITSTFNNTTVNNGEPCTFTPAVTGYVRATMYVYDRDTWQCVVGTTVGTPEPYGKYISPDVAIPGNDILAGKKWVVCGDSFTNGTDTGILESGDYAGEKIVYPYIIGNRTHINVIKFFKNGQTLAFPAEPGTFSNSLTCPSESYYYQNIPADADYITIYLGINDSHHAPSSSGGDGEDNTGVIPIGTITDETTATYYGAWNVVLTWLLTNRPFAHIGIIVSNGCDGDDYRLAQIAIAQKYGIPYLDLNGDDRCRAMIRSTNPNISAAVKAIIRDAQAVNYPTDSHPNNSAHKLQSTFIEAWLRTL